MKLVKQIDWKSIPHGHPEAALSPMWWRTGLNQEWGRERGEGERWKLRLSGAEGLIHQVRTFLLNEMRKPLQNEEINAKWLRILKDLSNCYVINRQNPSGSEIKNSPSMKETKETRVQSLGQEDPWSRKWQPAPVFLPGKFHGQRSLAGYCPWGLKESETTKWLNIWKWEKKQLRFLSSTTERIKLPTKETRKVS